MKKAKAPFCWFLPIRWHCSPYIFTLLGKVCLETHDAPLIARNWASFESLTSIGPDIATMITLIIAHHSGQSLALPTLSFLKHYYRRWPTYILLDFGPPSKSNLSLNILKDFTHLDIFPYQQPKSNLDLFST